MAVASDGTFQGTVGGGIMEHKLVELARKMLHEKSVTILIKRQVHDKTQATDQSGMICSGEQWIAFIPLTERQLHIIKQIVDSRAKSTKQSIILSHRGICMDDRARDPEVQFKYRTDTDWEYCESIYRQTKIHIIGGGHVGLALSETMSRLGFYVAIYDNRTDLLTMENNAFADEKYIVGYETIGEQILENPEEFVVIMTFGYRTDKVVLEQLWDKSFYYIGMMGSASKIQALRDDHVSKGIDVDCWSHVHAPIGINIHSKSAQEIAVSIAAEIILEKNKSAPSGRKD